MYMYILDKFGSHDKLSIPSRETLS